MKEKWRVLVIVLFLMSFASASHAAGQSELELLGKIIFNNKNLSFNRNQSCQTCHHPRAAFADPANMMKPTLFPVSEGSIPGNFGNRNAPSAAYAGFSPRFHWDGELFIGGVFWDGRASGLDVTATSPDTPSDPLFGTLPTYDPMADQAKGPFLNPIEMSLGSIEDVVDQVLKSKAARLLLKKRFPAAFDNAGNPVYTEAYNAIALAIAAFERSSQVNRFSSRFDKFWKEYGGDVSMFGITESGVVEIAPGVPFRRYSGIPAGFKSKFLKPRELIGLALFNADSAAQFGIPDTDWGIEGVPKNGGMCYLCHLTENFTVDEGDPNYDGLVKGTYPPLFTDFSYDNLGLPFNPVARELSGNDEPDIGLGGQPSLLDAAYQPVEGTLYPFISDEMGKFKVPSLRGVSRSAPYGHNGLFATLDEIVNFYNTRDVSTWPDPEVASTVNADELGNLGLGPMDELQIVQFMKTLNDRPRRIR